MSARKDIAIAQPKSNPTPVDLINTIITKGGDLSQLAQLMELQEKWEAKQAKANFNHARQKFMDDVGTVFKNKEGFGYFFASLDNIAKTIKPVLDKCDLYYSWDTDFVDGIVHVTCVISHVDGHEQRTKLAGGPDTSGKKNSIQAIGSTTSYLQRYTLVSALGLVISDQDSDLNVDDDGDGGQKVVPIKKNKNVIDKKQVEEILELIAKTKADTIKFCNHHKISSVAEMPAEQFEDCKTSLKTIAAQKARKNG
jgi:inorganic pyrophosphatase